MTKLKQQFDQPGRLAAAVIIASGILCFFCRKIFPVGFFVDDAMYILLAKTFFGYRVPAALKALVSPVDALPGYPFLLSILLPFVRESYGLLSLSSILFVLLSGSALFLALRKNGAVSALAAVSLFALNPTVTRYSGLVMTEPLFIFITLILLISVSQAPRSLRSWQFALFIWLSLIRPEGVLCIYAVLLGTWKERTPAERWWLGVLTPLPMIAFMVMGSRVAGMPHFHIFELLRQAHHLGDLPALAGRAKESLGLLFPSVMFQLPVPASSVSRAILGWGSVIFGTSLSVYGFFLYRRDAFFRAAALFLIFYFLIHIFWYAWTERYLLVALPLVAPAFVGGFSALFKDKGKRIASSLVLTGILGATYVSAQIKNIKESSSPIEAAWKNPAATFAFIGGLDPDKAILSLRAQTIYLMTHHRAVRYFLVKDETSFRSVLRQQNVGFVLLEDRSSSGMLNQAIYAGDLAEFMRWVLTGREFEEIYRNEAEGTRIFRLKEM